MNDATKQIVAVALAALGNLEGEEKAAAALFVVRKLLQELDSDARIESGNRCERRELDDDRRIIESDAWWIQRRGDMVCICEQLGASDEEHAANCPGCVRVVDLLYLLAGDTTADKPIPES